MKTAISASMLAATWPLPPLDTVSEIVLRGLELLSNEVNDVPSAVNIFLDALEKNARGAAYCLGVCYARGIVPDRGATDVFRLWESAEEDEFICFGLARCYLNGWGVEKNISIAEELFAEAEAMVSQAPPEFPPSQKVGEQPFLPQPLPQLQEKVPWQQSNAQKCALNPPANNSDFEILERPNSEVKTENCPINMQELDEAIAEGDANAMYKKGCLLKNGTTNIRRNQELAYNLFKEAAKHHPEACYELGMILESGIGGRADHTLALSYYQKAAINGIADAEVAFERLEKALYANQSETGAETTFKDNVENDNHDNAESTQKQEPHTESQQRMHQTSPSSPGVNADLFYNQAVFLMESQENKNNVKEAFEFMEEAARAGHLQAQYALSLMYRDGLGVESNMTEAFTWCERAASVNLISAFRDMGWYLENGCGVDKNLEAALHYYIAANENGFDVADDVARVSADLGEPEMQCANNIDSDVWY